MSKQRVASSKMRELHRYLGFFLAGIMAVYAVSGISLIFRDTDLLKVKSEFDVVISKNLEVEQLGKEIKIRRLKIDKTEGDIMFFKEGTYDAASGEAKYTIAKTPLVLDKLQHLHKADTGDPLYFLNIFFGLSLLFFVISAFWMFMPSSNVFKKGMIFTGIGIVLTLVLLFI